MVVGLAKRAQPSCKKTARNRGSGKGGDKLQEVKGKRVLALDKNNKCCSGEKKKATELERWKKKRVKVMENRPIEKKAP